MFPEVHGFTMYYGHKPFGIHYAVLMFGGESQMWPKNVRMDRILSNNVKKRKHGPGKAREAVDKGSLHNSLAQRIRNLPLSFLSF
jgi:hypothetical protein